MPFNVGPLELFLILAVVLLAFGAKRLPEVGAAMGKGIREFKKNIRDVKDSLDTNSDEEAPRRLVTDEPVEREPKKLSE